MNSWQYGIMFLRHLSGPGQGMSLSSVYRQAVLNMADSFHSGIVPVEHLFGPVIRFLGRHGIVKPF
jgi:hypothetical protein